VGEREREGDKCGVGRSGRREERQAENGYRERARAKKGQIDRERERDTQSQRERERERERERDREQHRRKGGTGSAPDHGAALRLDSVVYLRRMSALL
jgi:hypothetical protein